MQEGKADEKEGADAPRVLAFSYPHRGIDYRVGNPDRDRIWQK